MVVKIHKKKEILKALRKVSKKKARIVGFTFGIDKGVMSLTSLTIVNVKGR